MSLSMTVCNDWPTRGIVLLATLIVVHLAKLPAKTLTSVEMALPLFPLIR